MQLVIRKGAAYFSGDQYRNPKCHGGKYSAECYYTDPVSGKPRRVLRSTRIRVDGTETTHRTAEHAGRTLEAELNGARGQSRARQARGKGATTLGLAVEAAARALTLAGSSDKAVGIHWRSAVHPVRFFGAESDPWAIDEEALERYALYATKKRAPSTVLRELAALRAALKAAKVKPMPKSPKIGGVRARELAFDAEQLQRLFAHVPAARWPKTWPDRLDYLRMYAGLGLSYKELYGITEQGINWAAHTVRVFGTKRETRDRTMPMSPAIEAVLRRAVERMRERGDGVLFPAWNNVRLNERLSEAAQRAGLVTEGGRVSVNVLRASFCTELVRANVHPKKIQLLMGHSTPATANRWYMRLNVDKDLHDAVAVLPTL